MLWTGRAFNSFKEMPSLRQDMQLFAGSRTILVIGVVTFLTLLGTAISEPIRPLFIVNVGSTTLELGLIMALSSLVSLVTRIPASALADRLGRWRLMMFSLLISVATSALFAFVYDPILFYPLMSAAALSWSIFSPISVVVVSDRSTASTRGAVMGIYFSSIGAALLAGPLLCSVLTLFMGFRELFLFSAAFPILGTALFLLKADRSDVESRFIRDDKGTASLDSPLKGLVRILRVRNVAAMCYAQTAFALAFGVFSTVFAIYAEETLGFTPSMIALIFSFRALTNLLMRLPSGRISDKIGRRKPVIISHALIVAVFALLPFTQNLALLALLIVVYGIGWGMRVAPDAALVSESVSPSDRPLALATLMTMFDLGSTLGSLLVGVTATFLSIPNLFLLCTPILLSGSLVLFFLIHETLTH